MAENNVKIIKKDGIKFSLATILLMLGCTYLIILSTFLQLDITHVIIPGKIFSSEKLVFSDFLYTYKFIPQIPVIMFIGAFLGRRFGLISILLYIVLGLSFLPVFGLGGGPKYILEYGFGYILAYVPAMILADIVLENGFSNKNILKASLIGVLTIHVLGILYMLFIAGLQHEGGAFIKGWIIAQSGIKIIYDFVFSFAALFTVRYAKIVLWFFM